MEDRAAERRRGEECRQEIGLNRLVSRDQEVRGPMEPAWKTASSLVRIEGLKTDLLAGQVLSPNTLPTLRP